jgi:multicomponent Na+:H+ antiporter subunit D
LAANRVVFLVAVGLLYGVTGTLNMADLSEKVAALHGTAKTVAQSVAVLLLFVFGLKAAIFPLYFWLPDGYPAAPATVSAFLGGVATKVGVYSMMRVFPLIFSSQQQIVGEALMALGAVTMLVGVLGAVCQLEIRRLLSFHIVSQIGYLIFGLGLFSQAGIAAAVFYMAHYTIVKCALFLVAGIIERVTGENNLKKMGGLMESFPALSALFFVAGLSLAGLPPWSGFFAKLVIVKAGFEAGQYLYAGVAVVTGFFTLYSMMKIWQMVFWSEKTGEHREQPRLIYAGVVLLLSFSVIFAAGFSPMNRFALETAGQLLDAPAYRRAVLEANPKSEIRNSKEFQSTISQSSKTDGEKQVGFDIFHLDIFLDFGFRISDFENTETDKGRGDNIRPTSLATDAGQKGGD